MKIKDLQKALLGIEEKSQLSPEVVQEALKEALTKAYRKQVGLDDVAVRVEIEKGCIELFHQREVVEEVYDDEMEISLQDARIVNVNAQLGDFIDEEVDFTKFDRGAVVLAKNVIKQKIREAEKLLVYEEYCDKVDEMVLGTVESAEEKFTLVNIGKTIAMMKKSDSIKGEVYAEGKKINVVISEVNKETKGAQVLVSRATPVFVRRLFEREVPEIYNGIIEIKAIARSAGERCKIAVYSHNENIDPIGACIGPRGSRVQTIINELHGEKIDIFEWSDNISELIKNALSPSTALAVFPNQDPSVRNGLIVVVPDNQLSLAIGKQGKNARLAVKLSNRKIDIKSESEMVEYNEKFNVDYMELAKQMEAEYQAKKEEERAYRQKQKSEELRNAVEEVMDVEDVQFEYAQEEEIVLVEEDENAPAATLFEKEQKEAEVPAEEIVVEEEIVEEVDEMEEAARIAKEKRKEKTASDIKEYTSKFENFANATKKEEAPVKAKKKKEVVEEEFVEEEAQEEVKEKKYENMRIIYSEEELAEIEEAEDEEAWYDEDVDYEEYDEYYDD
ncbi:MAG: transcription termination/antitermination protein NusA [Firmicutes bacterium]|nr:transcription termination/antitermination protein NusA [Bacillota bacterium]